ncbi:uncharacterized protein LOC119828816 isoform X2 [Zerene cesonia]|uniref:uncharacterized protein LOC119828816 isoform X2 n=1 Tax=Zerene cesonia TaxID=33412 RepID=UPI0018E4E3A7|nr:uncharacterized protein LOC119828816 isoform X2 [Zerene cesonia]
MRKSIATVLNSTYIIPQAPERYVYYSIYAEEMRQCLDTLEMACKIILLVLVACCCAHADYRSDGGFLPSPTYQRTEDQLAEPAARIERSRDERDNQADKSQRFGISTYGATGPYGATAPGIYGPLKIDLGGVLLGSILGFGAVVVLPKIIHAFSFGYGGYGRSAETELGSISDLLGQFDETLSRYNVDSASCMQRLACSYVQLANENMAIGNATDFDVMLSSVARNSLVRRLFDGTSVYEAISAGRSLDTDCEQRYSKCKLDRTTVVKIITQIVPS